MAAVHLETPSRLWRRIQDIEGQDMPSLPSIPHFDDSADSRSETTDSADLSRGSEPMTSTPAALSTIHTMSTIKQPLSTESTQRFANSIASRSTKSGMSASGSRGSVSSKGAAYRFQQQDPPKQYSFDISMIPSLPHPPDDDMDARSSDPDSESSVGDAYLPPIDPPTGLDDDLDISDALQSISRSGLPVEQAEPTPKKKYNYSVSLKSEPRPSPFDKLRNVSFRRPLSRNTRTPSLTRTSTPSPNSSTSHSTPQSVHSLQISRSQPASPTPGTAVPLPRSTTASPTARSMTASPLARYVPLPPSTATSPATRFSPRTALRVKEEPPTDDELEVPSVSLPPHPDMTMESESHDESSNLRESRSDDRDPTFSSTEGLTPSPRGPNDHNEQPSTSLTQLASALSSPAPSVMYTPTPTFQPRPRARFNLAPTSTTPPDPPTEESQSSEDQGHEDESTWRPDYHDDPATPQARRRSFLLSVINSSTRPRVRHMTPQPERIVEEPETPATVTQARTALAGATPRARLPIRPRLSHPLTQHIPTQAESAASSGSEAPPQSPAYDGAVDRASFISTTSSQDLTTHARANQSFDPVMGLGDRGHGVGRFNAGKLNNYLHGLNRKLQEENEVQLRENDVLREENRLLAEELAAYKEKHGETDSERGSTPPGEPRPSAPRRRSSGGRRVSAIPQGLGDVQEYDAEAWAEEKAQMEEWIEDLKEELEKVTKERQEREEALEEERGERVKDKERFKQRMADVEKGVQEIVEDLDKKLHEAEKKVQTLEKEKAQALKEVERRLAEVVVERDVLAERMEKTEGVLTGGKDLGVELNAANERVAQVLGDLKNANIQLKGLEEEVAHADEHIGALEKELDGEKKLVSELEEELRHKSDELTETLEKMEALAKDAEAAQQDAEQYHELAAQLEADAEAANQRVASLEQQLAASQNKLEAVMATLDQEQEKSNRLGAEAEKATDLVRQMEEALEAAEEKMRADSEQITNMKLRVSALEREVDKSRSREQSQSHTEAEAQAEIEAMEAELDEAHKEIARLNTLLTQSPARKAMDRAKDSKIEMLEHERDELLERLRTLKTNSMTPGKMSNLSTMSPMHRHILSMTMKSPKTPGGPLRDLSWLQSTMNDPTMSPLVAEIERLQIELDRANESIDDKLDRLEDAGLGVISLTNQLEDARAKIVNLEDEIGRLHRREDRRAVRLEKLRCQKCLVKVDTRSLQHHSVGDESSIIDPADISLPDEPPTPPTKTTERLRAEIQAVTQQLTAMKQQWDGERRELLGENASLKDATNRLNAEVRQAKSEVRRFGDVERTKLGVQGEVERAKQIIEELEDQLKAERARLRALTTEQTKAEQQREEVVLQLRRTEADMADVRDELQRIKQENHELERELRINATVEQKARLLENKVSENAETIEQLRNERALLVADHKKLQKQFTQVSEQVNKLRERHAVSQTSHDQRRHALDLRQLEIEDLRRALSNQADELHRAGEERTRAVQEKGDLSRTVAALEEDLRRVRRDAEAFGRDLRQLRAQKDKLEAERREDAAKADRAQKQAQTQIRLLKDEAREQREKAKVVQQQWQGHVCAADSASLMAITLQHKEECKGLIVQIKYLKAKWTREEALRTHLGQQKQYLLGLLAQCERTEQKILSEIAKIGFPGTRQQALPAPRRKRKSLREVALSVMFVIRAKRSSDSWREQRSSKRAIMSALQDVRKARGEKTAGKR